MANPENSPVETSNDTNANSTNYNMMTMNTWQAQRQGFPNGNGYGYAYQSGYPNFASQYAYAAPPQQAATINMYGYPAVINGYPAVNINGYPAVNMNVNGYNAFYPNANATAYPSYYYNNNTHNFYQLPSTERPRPQYQYNQLRTQLQPTGGFNSRRNGPVDAGSMQRRTATSTATATATDILDEYICIGPRYMRMRDQGTLTGSGGEDAHDEYNYPGFNTRYENGKFFVIKSCNKEDVLNSIRHRIWASTPMANHTLNAAYDEAQGEQSIQRIGSGTNTASPNCPVFLLFSINGSRNFCGVAEMVGHVDFEARIDFWDKRGKFPVKWHIIKDVPFTEVRHITVENNGNQSIIYSPDVQQVEIEKGQAMLDIFRIYVWTTTLLDEFTLRVKLLVRRPTSTQERYRHQEEEKHREVVAEDKEEEEQHREEAVEEEEERRRERVE